MKVNWTIKNVKDTGFDIQLDIDQPYIISYQVKYNKLIIQEENWIEVKFEDNGLFIDRESGKAIDINYSTYKKMPK